MRWIDLRTGYACNNTCRFCGQGDRRSRFAEAPLGVLKDVLLANGVPKGAGIWLAGGEVTLRRDLPALVALCRDIGFARVGIQTNGRILAAAGAADSLRRVGLTDAAVALHAPTSPIHDHLVGVVGAYAQAVAGARRLVAAGVALHVATVMTRSTTEVLPAIAALAVRLQARSHRWLMCRAEGAALVDDRALVPRYALVRDPLRAAIVVERDARLDVETVGVPFCVLPGDTSVIGDRVDLPRVNRLFPPGLEEVSPQRVYGPPCEGCGWRAVCPGVASAYVDRWGWEELGERRSDLGSGDVVEILVDGPSGPVASRRLRQALVGAAVAPDRTLVFTGQSPWRHPTLPTLVREAVRLRFAAVGVRGPLAPLAEADDADLSRLDGLAWMEAQDLDTPIGQVAVARLRSTVAGCEIRDTPR